MRTFTCGLCLRSYSNYKHSSSIRAYVLATRDRELEMQTVHSKALAIGCTSLSRVADRCGRQ
uniref:SFRICE_002293 n=1 Tax=Spodoptera frugiperda TaxID=7108 RepID=A0A2H1WPH5_SPOFR